MDYAKEITQLETQLADADRAQQSAVMLRARRAELVRAQELLAEAQRREREAQEAAKAAEMAEADDRRAQAVPLVVALDDCAREMTDLDTEAERALWTFVRDVMRPLHERRAAIVMRHHDALARLRVLSREAAADISVQHPATLGEFVRVRWQRFDGRGRAGTTSHWERALLAEEED